MDVDLSARLDQLNQIIPSTVQVYLVGGAVRDRILSLAVHDLDFVLDKDSILTARRVADELQAAYYPLDSERDTGRVILMEPGNDRLVLDFSLQRGPDLESDLRGRDFTLNAMAFDLRNPLKLIDPLGGLDDLRHKRLRACSPDAFSTDPLRIMRGVRLATSYHFLLDPETLHWMKASIPLLPQVSIERICDELFRILDGSQPAVPLRTLDYLGVLTVILPELQALRGLKQPPPHIADALEHTLSVVQNLDAVFNTLALEYNPDTSANLFLGLVSLRLGRYREHLRAHLKTSLNPGRSLRGLLFLAGLYHDIGKPGTQTVDEAGKLHFYSHEAEGSRISARRARSLHLSNEETERLAAVVRYHMHPLFYSQNSSLPSRRTIYRFFRDAGVAGVDACLLSLADTLATYGPGLPQGLWEHQLDVVRTLLEAWWERRSESVSPPAMINGSVLMEKLGLAPGREVGRILEAVREAQAVGQVNDAAEALEFARSLMEGGE